MSSDITQVDVRGPRFAAWITTAVLIATLIVSAFNAPTAAVILGAQAVVFAIGALRGPRNSPYGALFAKLVAPRLGPVKEREPVPPLKFAQLVGLIFAVIGVVAFAAALPLPGAIATAFALFAAFSTPPSGSVWAASCTPSSPDFAARPLPSCRINYSP